MSIIPPLKNNLPEPYHRKTKIQIFKNYLQDKENKRASNEIEFKKDAKMTQQKERRVPLQLQEAVEKKIDKLLAGDHILRVEKVNDEVFTQHVVITVKKAKSVKVALDARLLNNEIQKERYQMPNLDTSLEQVAEIINANEKRTVMFTSLAMLYAYGLTKRHPETAKPCYL